MLRPKRVKNGTTGTGRISGVVVVAWLIFGWSRPAFPDEQPHLRLAPIQFGTTFGGSLGYTYLSNSYGTSKSTQQMFDVGVNVGVRARSYIWQPWFARLSGGLGIGVGAIVASSNVSPVTKSGNTTITGEAALNLVPQSRFPFEARVYRTKTQSSGFLSGINSAYLTSGLRLTQNYRSRDGRLNSSAYYSHSTSGRVSFGTEEVRNQLNFNLTTSSLDRHQTFRVVGTVTSIDYPLVGESSLAETLVANHLYQPNFTLSVASLASLIKTDYSSTPLPPVIGQQQEGGYNSQQFSSFAAWRPEAVPITLTGSARLLRSNSRSNGVTGPQYVDMNLNLGANYAWSPLLRMYGSVNVNDNSGIQTVSTNAGLSARKGFGGGADPITFWGFRYTRYVGASLSNQTIATQNTTTSGANQTTTSSVQQLGLTLGHGLSKRTQLGSGSLNMNLNQGLATVLSTQGSPVTKLNSGGSLSWNRSEAKAITSMRLNAADSRTLSGKQDFYQVINLQGSRTQRMAHNESLIGTLTVQGSRSGRDDIPTTPFIASPSADLSYRHLRLFGVKNLAFDSTLRILGADIVSSQDLANRQGLSTQKQASAYWDNNLQYFIGRLNFKLLTRIAQVNKVTQTSIYFNMNRTF